MATFDKKLLAYYTGELSLYFLNNCCIYNYVITNACTSSFKSFFLFSY